MQLSLRLDQLLNWGEEKKRGKIREICEATKLERYQVSDLIHNKVKYISLETLSKICGYLVDQGLADPSVLPGELFRREPNEFWALLRDRDRIEVCMGARSDPNWRDLLVSAADAELQSRIFKIVTGAGEEGDGKKKARSHPGLALDPRLIPAPDLKGKNLKRFQNEALRLYREFDEEKRSAEKRSKAFVLLGSVKSNLASERTVADAFAGARPFISEDEVPQAHERSCPFVMLYRKNDPQHPSCYAGKKLSRTDRRRSPGIYYEAQGDEWEFLPWTDESRTEESQDAALVFYRFQKVQGRVDMLLGGYSGRGTRGIAQLLQSGKKALWPPCYEDKEVAIGAFVLQFTYAPTVGADDPISRAFQRYKHCEVISLPKESIERRLPPRNRQGSRRKKRGGPPTAP